MQLPVLSTGSRCQPGADEPEIGEESAVTGSVDDRSANDDDLDPSTPGVKRRVFAGKFGPAVRRERSWFGVSWPGDTFRGTDGGIGTQVDEPSGSRVGGQDRVDDRPGALRIGRFVFVLRTRGRYGGQVKHGVDTPHGVRECGAIAQVSPNEGDARAFEVSRVAGLTNQGADTPSLGGEVVDQMPTDEAGRAGYEGFPSHGWVRKWGRRSGKATVRGGRSRDERRRKKGGRIVVSRTSPDPRRRCRGGRWRSPLPWRS
jgi:hypothetical protein